MKPKCVIIGAGHAGSQAAASLRLEGYAGDITLISDEADVPYHRPPLSKTYLKAPEHGGLVLRPESFYQANDIELLLEKRVVSIAVADKMLTLQDGTSLVWDKLVFATGARARMPQIDGVELDGVVTLRTMADARSISERLSTIKKVVIIGGGFIGMEIAHTFASLGKETLLVEAAPRVLARSVGEIVSAHVETRSVSAGIQLIKNTFLNTIQGVDGKVTGITTSDGALYAADLVVIGVGAIPNTELAQAIGLTLDNGIVVDSHLQTSEPDIYAIGDCASFEHPLVGGLVRLESVQNATDQAKHLARILTGKPSDYHEIAWFWSDQGDMKLQAAGLITGSDRQIISGNPEDNAFSIYHFKGDRLVAVDSVNRPADHMVARKLMAANIQPLEEDIKAGPARLKEMVMPKKG